MKMQMIDSLDEDEAREFTGCRVIDESGEPVGTMDGFWMDPSTHRVAFLGVKSSWLSGNVHVVPARDAQLVEQDNLVKLGYPTAFIKRAPTFSPEGGFAQVGAKHVLTRLISRFPGLKLVWADGGYAGKLVDWVATVLHRTLSIVKRPRKTQGFGVLQWRWIVERTFGWLNRSRRLSKDFEALPETTETWIRIAMIQLMTKRLAAKT